MARSDGHGGGKKGTRTGVKAPKVLMNDVDGMLEIARLAAVTESETGQAKLDKARARQESEPSSKAGQTASSGAGRGGTRQRKGNSSRLQHAMSKLRAAEAQRKVERKNKAKKQSSLASSKATGQPQQPRKAVSFA